MHAIQDTKTPSPSSFHLSTSSQPPSSTPNNFRIQLRRIRIHQNPILDQHSPIPRTPQLLLRTTRPGIQNITNLFLLHRHTVPFPSQTLLPFRPKLIRNINFSRSPCARWTLMPPRPRKCASLFKCPGRKSPSVRKALETALEVWVQSSMVRRALVARAVG